MPGWPAQTSPFGDTVKASLEPGEALLNEHQQKMVQPSMEGKICNGCGGMMQRTGACHTCSSCGNTDGCG